MSLEKILIIGVALLVIGGVYSFANGVADQNNTATETASGNQDTFSGTIGGWTW